MTYLEKYLQEYPDEKFINKIYWDWCPKNSKGENIACPYSKIVSSHDRRTKGYCGLCWNQEIPEEYPTMSVKEYNEFIEKLYEETIDKTIEQDDRKLVTVYSDGCEVKKPVDISSYDAPIIKDSGKRREFETGAVRDIQKGKGRCDLMPLDVVSILLNNDDILAYINKFQKTDDVNCLYWVLSYFKDPFYPDFATMLLEVSKHFEAGAEKYGEYNWQKGIPTHCYIDSAVRHYLKHLRGDRDEPHDRAFVWNILCCIWTCINKPELDDYRKDNEEPSNG